MTTITCQYTGIQFEAASARSKNHPKISALLTAAQKQGAYGRVLEALKTAREAGATDIDTFIAAGEAAIKGQRYEYQAIRAAYLDRQDARSFAKQRREKVNAILFDHGYRWYKDAIGSEESTAPGGLGAGIGEEAGFRWTLIAPDGSETTVADALAAIERK